METNNADLDAQVASEDTEHHVRLDDMRKAHYEQLHALWRRYDEMWDSPERNQHYARIQTLEDSFKARVDVAWARHYQAIDAILARFGGSMVYGVDGDSK